MFLPGDNRVRRTRPGTSSRFHLAAGSSSPRCRPQGKFTRSDINGNRRAADDYYRARSSTAAAATPPSPRHQIQQQVNDRRSYRLRRLHGELLQGFCPLQCGSTAAPSTTCSTAPNLLFRQVLTFFSEYFAVQVGHSKRRNIYPGAHALKSSICSNGSIPICWIVSPSFSSVSWRYLFPRSRIAVLSADSAPTGLNWPAIRRCSLKS